MSEMTDIFSADVAAIEPDLPVQFFFKGKEYTGSKTQTVDSIEMQDAGFQQKYDFELFVRANAWGTVTPPIINDPEAIMIRSIRYRVEQITPSQDDVGSVYHMVQRT